MPKRGRHRRKLRDALRGRSTVPPSLVGPRGEALQERKRKRRTSILRRGGAAALAVPVLAASTYLVFRDRSSPRRGTPPQIAQADGADGVTTLLLFGTRESAGDRADALWLTLLAIDEDSDLGSVVYIPAGTAVEVPGRGLHGVGDSLASGGVPLLLISVENLLGVSLDGHIELSDRDARVLFDAIEPLSVDVPAEVRVSAGRARARLIFQEGLQRLPAEFLVRLLYTIGIEGDDQELGGRHLAFWSALLSRYSSEPKELGAAVAGAGAAIDETAGKVERHAAVFEALAARGDDTVLAQLPVRQVSVGGTELYETDRDELDRFIQNTLGVKRATRDDVRVQILNGNGAPGIGHEVARKLVGHGFRVILSGNARRLNYRKTLVVTYDGSEQGVALARRARDLLGLGEIQIGAQDQGIVDLTIVVGRDFLRRP